MSVDLYNATCHWPTSVHGAHVLPTPTSSLSNENELQASFPDGKLPCSNFPLGYGPVPLYYLDLGGWIGLQNVTIVDDSVTHITTGVGGDRCEDGMMCSYACPSGYQKSQWPSTQGLHKESVGGLHCRNGVLFLTNPQLSQSLCIPGTGGVQIQNQAAGPVAVCRTDYPGTESETIPTEAEPGMTEPLTCPDAATYFKWDGQDTSAQYYLNPVGYKAAEACRWGTQDSDIGNFAPINLGVGANNGTVWLSIFANTPTTTKLFNGTVKLDGNLSGPCSYANGTFCGVDGCNTHGCTVAVHSGTATYVVSDGR